MDFGKIQNPLKTAKTGYGDITGQGGLGPVDLLSNIFQLVAIAAGIFSVINLILAGMMYIQSQGDAKMTEQAWQKIYMSLIGLIIIVMSYVIAALIGQILFGRANYIFSPEIQGPGTITP